MPTESMRQYFSEMIDSLNLSLLQHRIEVCECATCQLWRDHFRIVNRDTWVLKKAKVFVSTPTEVKKSEHAYYTYIFITNGCRVYLNEAECSIHTT
jgi:hypothetical protein